MVIQQSGHTALEMPLADEDARDAILNGLDRTLFVEASAGTGKTQSLVGRVVNLVATGKATLDRVAAITFTEAAAAELRDRIRQQLEAAGDDESRSDDERRLCRQGVADLDQAAISTLHAFASLILHERPLEAGLPPAFETSDEIAAGIGFNEAWDEWLNNALEEDSPLAGPMSVALNLDMKLSSLRETALKFHRNYVDLEGVQFIAPPPGEARVTDAITEALPELERLCRYSRIGVGDPLFDHVQGKLAGLRRLAEAESGSPASLRLASRMLPLKCSNGKQSDWERDPETGKNACAVLKGLLGDLDASANDEIDVVRLEALMPILEGIRQFVLQYAEQRRRDGRAEFHDLLVWARQLLRDSLDVRDHFRRRFTHLLIDEAQDTDPIQAEIAMLLAEATPAGSAAEDRPRSWEQITPEKGKLFVVGDPKQSIYRFRRADVVQMTRLRERIRQAGGGSVSLVQNFRSQERLVSWVNHVFGQWMPDGSESQTDEPSLQAKYEAMHARRNDGSDGDSRPRVWALANIHTEDNTGQVREDESRDIAALLQQIVSTPWQTMDRTATDSAGQEAYRPVKYSDICLLLPTRTGLQGLERELERSEIPYRLESASLIFETQEIRDLLNCLRSIDDPSNQVATVAALRSPAFGCSDVELLLHRESGGSFNYLADQSQRPDAPVVEGLGVLHAFHERRTNGSIGALIDGFVRDRMLMEVATDHPRMREQWRRYRFMVEQAWQFSAVAGNSLRAFVDWIEEQVDGRAQITESPVPETDEDAVRVMTIHAAKGLEFPVVVLTGINSRRTFRSDIAYFDRDRARVGVGFTAGKGRFETEDFSDLAKFERDMHAAEGVRLMYVAATRARDHLVLSMRRPKGAWGSGSQAGVIANFLEGHPQLWTDVVLAAPPSAEDDAFEDGTEDDSSALEAVESAAEHSVEARDQWQDQRKGLLEELRRPSTMAATALGYAAPGDSDAPDGPVEQDDKPEPVTDEPWRRGRAGSEVGRAVHAVLQGIDLATGDGIPERARAQAVVEGVPDREDDIADFARAAVASDIVKRAVASGRLWREVPVAVGMGGGSLHGFIDLLFEEDDGLVVVDYKTDSVTSEAAAEAVQRYRLQGGAYAYAVEQVTGKRVKDVIFLYLQPQSEERLPDLPQAMRDAQVQALSRLDPASALPE